MNNELAFNLMTHIEKELSKLAAFDAGAGKKGFEKQLAKAHKDGYVEGMSNIRKILLDWINSRKTD
jgi:hypothetical protein